MQVDHATQSTTQLELLGGAFEPPPWVESPPKALGGAKRPPLEGIDDEARDAVRDLAWRLRWPRPGASRPAVSLVAVAHALNVTVEYRPVSAHIGAFAIGGRLVVLPSDTVGTIRGRDLRAACHRRFLLAHELGHIVMQRGWVTPQIGREELAADWFALDLLVPQQVLQQSRHESLSSIARRLLASTRDVAAQLLDLRRVEGAVGP